MIRIKNKVYTPKPLMIGLSLAMILISGFMVEGASNLHDFILPAILVLIFGYIGLSGDHQ